MATISKVTLLLLGLATTLAVVVHAVQSKKALVFDDAIDYKPIHPNDNPEHFGKRIWLSRRGSYADSRDSERQISKMAVTKPSKEKAEKMFLNLKELLKEKLHLKDGTRSSFGTGSKTFTMKSSHLNIHDPSIKVISKRATGDDSGADAGPPAGGDDAKATKKPKGKKKGTKKSKASKKLGTGAPGTSTVAPGASTVAPDAGASTAAPDAGTSTTGAPGFGGTTGAPKDDSTAKPSDGDSTTKTPKSKLDDEDKIIKELLKDKADEKKIISKVFNHSREWAEWLIRHRSRSLNRALGSRVKEFIKKNLLPYLPEDPRIFVPSPLRARPAYPHVYYEKLPLRQPATAYPLEFVTRPNAAN